MTKLNKKQLKKLYDYGGTLSPKNWADMVDSLGPMDNNDSETIIKTTYESVRDLYYKGEMILGVKYEFDYNFASAPDTKYSIPGLQVYLTPDGNLKAKGTYVYDTDAAIDVRDFVADFEFDSILACPLTNDMYIYESYKTHMVFETFSDLEPYLKQYNFNYKEFDSEIVQIQDVVIVNSVEIETDETYDVYNYIINKSGLIIRINTETLDIDTIQLEYEPGAIIYNIQYADRFHSTLVDGYETNMRQDCICEASIYGSSKDDYIIWSDLSGDTINNGTIINSTLLDIEASDLEDYNPVIIISNMNLNNNME